MRSFRTLYLLPMMLMILLGGLSTGVSAKDKHIKGQFEKSDKTTTINGVDEAVSTEPSGKLTGRHARQKASIREGAGSRGMSAEQAEMLRLIKEMDADIAVMEKQKKTESVIRVDKVTGELIREDSSGKPSTTVKPTTRAKVPKKAPRQVSPKKEALVEKKTISPKQPPRPVAISPQREVPAKTKPAMPTSLKPVKVVKKKPGSVKKPASASATSRPVAQKESLPGLEKPVRKKIAKPVTQETPGVTLAEPAPVRKAASSLSVESKPGDVKKKASPIQPIKLAAPKESGKNRNSGISARMIEPGSNAAEIKGRASSQFSVTRSEDTAKTIEPAQSKNTVQASKPAITSKQPDSTDAGVAVTRTVPTAKTATTTTAKRVQASSRQRSENRISETIEISKADAIDESALPAAARWYLEKARGGDREAQFNLGSLFETGFGVQQNYRQAANWYLRAAEQEHALAQLKLGVLYLLGLGVRESSLKGSRWIRASDKNGIELSAMINDKVLALETEEGIDTKKIIAEVHKSLDKGDIYAQEKLIQVLARLKKQRENQPKKERFAGKVTGSGAKEGTVGNQVPSFLRTDGGGTVFGETDFVEIQRQANEGDVESQYLLGRMYETGQKVKYDYLQAYTWYNSASVQGHREAQYRLALAYIYGRGVEVNTTKGGLWLHKAAAQKHEASGHLIRYFTSEVDGAVSYNKSIVLSWYLERAIAGDGNAQFAIGYLLENGWGVNQKVSEAREWYAKARAIGTHDASVQLRRMKISNAATDPVRTASSSFISPPPSPQASATRPGAGGTSLELKDLGSPSSSQLKSLMVPIGLLMIGLTMVMVVFRWLDKGMGTARNGAPRDRPAM